VWDNPELVKLARLNDKRLESARAPKNMQKETQPKTANDLPPEARTHKLRRTLFVAGVFALLAMLFVPTPEQHGHRAGYRWIFDRSDTSIAFFQLLVNVAFAALLGAILATIVLLESLSRCLGVQASGTLRNESTTDQIWRDRGRGKTLHG